MKTKTPTDATSPTYFDLNCVERCMLCRQVVKMKGGAETVPVLKDDIEAVAVILSELLDTFLKAPEEQDGQLFYAEMVTRFEQAVGRTVRQMAADVGL